MDSLNPIHGSYYCNVNITEQKIATRDKQNYKQVWRTKRGMLFYRGKGELIESVMGF